MAFDVGSVRAAYPALADGFAYLDGAAGTQVPASVIEAIGAAYRAGLGNAGGEFPASLRSTALTAECRQAVADLVGGHADGVILGPNMTTLTYRLAYTLASRWGAGDEVVLSRLDHDANVRPWMQAAQRAGARIRWAEVDISTGELPAAQYADLLSEPDPAGRGHRGQQRPGHPAGRRRDHRPGPRGGSAQRTWTACTPPRTGRST